MVNSHRGSFGHILSCFPPPPSWSASRKENVSRFRLCPLTMVVLLLYPLPSDGYSFSLCSRQRPWLPFPLTQRPIDLTFSTDILGSVFYLSFLSLAFSGSGMGFLPLFFLFFFCDDSFAGWISLLTWRRILFIFPLLLGGTLAFLTPVNRPFSL